MIIKEHLTLPIVTACPPLNVTPAVPKRPATSLGASGVRESLTSHSSIVLQTGDEAICEAPWEGGRDVGGWDFLLDGELVEAVKLHTNCCGGNEGGDESKDSEELHFGFG
jgi:hypothetical protein